MAVLRSDYYDENGNLVEDMETITSDLGISLIDLDNGIIYPYTIIIKKEENRHFIEYLAELGSFPPDRMEKEIKVV